MKIKPKKIKRGKGRVEVKKMLLKKTREHGGRIKGGGEEGRGKENDVCKSRRCDERIREYVGRRRRKWSKRRRKRRSLKEIRSQQMVLRVTRRQ